MIPEMLSRCVKIGLVSATILLITACATKPVAPDKATVKSVVPDIAAIKKEVMATESAFAKTMADRNLDAFASFLSTEAVFFSGPKASIGKAEITEVWKRYFENPEAPFSWEPERVEVLASGTLAMSTGPVYDNRGKKVASFNSVWRLEEPGVWKIVFDKGAPANDCTLVK